MPSGGMTIGRLAKEAGVNVETVRYYQRRGLIDEPAKPSGGHRRYQPAALKRIAFIRRAQSLGFSLAEIAILLKYSDGTNWKETRQIAEKKVESLVIHIDQLRKICSELSALIEESKLGKGKGMCPIIKSISCAET
jgi:MerR family transcriptional regulator, mercuric resistance operon regulatory protein